MSTPTGPSSPTRVRALQVYAAHFAAHGYRGTSLDGVAREVGVRKPSLYHHFPGGKETLHTEVALSVIESRGGDLARALAVPGGLDARLRAVITEVVADPTGATTSFEQHLFDSLPELEAGARERINEAYARCLLDPMMQCFECALERGEVVGADAQVLCHAFLHLARAVDMMGEPGAAAGQLVGLFLGGARPRV